MKAYEYRGLPTGDLELRTTPAGAVITGYAAVFDKTSHPLGGFVERIAPGAFKRYLGSGGEVLGLFNHQEHRLLGRRTASTLKVAEDSKGLHYEVSVNRSDPEAVSVAAMVERGDVTGSSFSFRITSDGDEWDSTDSGYPLRIVRQVAEVRDVGPAVSPAYPDASAKAASRALVGLAETRSLPLDAVVEAALDDRLADYLRRPVDRRSADEIAAARARLRAMTQPR